MHPAILPCTLQSCRWAEPFVLCRVAKLAGDKRADVAEKGFGRPFSRVVIAQSGLGG